MKKILHRENWGLLFLGTLIVLVVIAAYTSKWQLHTTTANEYTELIPRKIEQNDAGVREIYLDMSGYHDVNNSLMFYTNHQIVDVYADGVLIYSLQKSGSVFGRTTGSVWHCFEVPLEIQELRIVLTPIYKGIGMGAVQFQFGNGVRMLMDMVAESMGDVMICLVIFCLGVFFLLYWLSVFSQNHSQRELLYFGLFCIIFGIWSFGETYLAMRIVEDRALASYLAFSCLMAMPVPFVLFVREFFRMEKSHVHRRILGYLVAVSAVCQILHLTGILGVKQTAPVTLVGIVIGILYLIYCFLRSYKELPKRTVRTHIIGVSVLVLFGIVDAATYFIDRMKANQFGKVGVLLYIVIWGAEMAYSAQEKLKQAQTMEIYKEMAEKDMLTGCYNRNAYGEDIRTMDPTGAVMLAFDLNDLKKHNDTRGHIAGDQYIIDAALLIGEVFGHLGKVYRVGGDEFCIMVKDIAKEEIKGLQGRLAAGVQQYSEANADPDFGIAFGYAVYDGALDRNMEDTRNRADVYMYKNKREMKETN